MPPAHDMMKSPGPSDSGNSHDSSYQNHFNISKNRPQASCASFYFDLVTLIINPRPGQNRAQFADVARPRVIHQNLDRLFAEFFLLEQAGAFSKQLWDALAPLSQGGDTYRQHVETEIEVLAKEVLSDQLEVVLLVKTTSPIYFYININ